MSKPNPDGGNKMQYAEKLDDIIKAFGPEALDGDNLNKFYEETMSTRTGDPYWSPIYDIYDACIRVNEHNAHLLQGHKGCGKSTELNRLRNKFVEDGFEASIISCALKMDMPNAAYVDLLILIAGELIEIAGRIKCNVNEDILESIRDYWKDVEVVRESVRHASLGVAGEISAGMSGPWTAAVNLFAKLFGELKFGVDTRKTIRETVERNSAEWIGYIRIIADTIASMSDGKRPVLIFEDLDKMDPATAMKIFHDYASTLSQMPFPVIYTFPIGPCYDTGSGDLRNYYNCGVLPMIKIHTVNGDDYDDGLNIIRTIVKKRADMKLISRDALNFAIKKTGGSLRDLFKLIVNAARRASRRGAASIALEDVRVVIEELKSSLTRSIEQAHYSFLASIYNGNHEIIENGQTLMKMLQAGVVLEYNGTRWHDLHPLIRDFFEEQNLTQYQK
jgi:hypothetical protein